MIRVVGEVPWEVLEDQIRHVPLLQPREDQIIFPYLHAQITLKEISYDDVRPTSLYALRGNLSLQQKLAQELAPSHDPLALKGALRLLSDQGKEIGLIPPIVEETEENGKYILDGLHRTLAGRQTGRTHFTAIYITDFRSDCPAAVLPNEWDDIKLYDEVPADPALKRRYRENQMSLRRDFSELNGSRPRQTKED